MDKLLKKIADLILALVAILGLLLGFLNLLPQKIEVTDILILSGLVFFVLFIALITNHVSMLEEKINNLIKEKEIDKRLIKIKNKLRL